MPPPSQNRVLLRAAALFKRFGRISAVNNLSLDLCSGECLGLLGPNGAGKSTTLALLCGLQSPDLGSITVLGERDPAAARVRRVMGLVPQELALYPDLTVRENLTFFARIHGLAGERMHGRVSNALELAALGPRADSLVRTLSGGMQRRLNLACALLGSPQLLLLDEPTVGVDAQSRNHIFECIRTLKREGVALLYSTHYMEEVEALCDRVVVVDHGQVVASGTPRDLLSAHGGHTVLRARVDASLPIASELSCFVGNDGWMRLPCDDVRTGLDRLLLAGLSIDELHVERARLEDVVLTITGKGVRG